MDNLSEFFFLAFQNKLVKIQQHKGWISGFIIGEHALLEEAEGDGNLRRRWGPRRNC